MTIGFKTTTVGLRQNLEPLDAEGEHRFKTTTVGLRQGKEEWKKNLEARFKTTTVGLRRHQRTEHNMVGRVSKPLRLD